MLDKHLYVIGPLLVNVSAAGVHLAVITQGVARWYITVTVPLSRSACLLRKRRHRRL